MKLRVALPGIVAALAIVGGIALAQAPTTLWLAQPTGQEADQIVQYNPSAPAAFLTVAQQRDARGYQKLVPTTGQTIVAGGSIGCNPTMATAGTCTSVLQLTPAGTLSTLTIKTPLYPVDGQMLQIFTTQAITTLTMTASQSQTLNGGLTTLSANSGGMWIYSQGSTASNGTWDRIW